MKMINNRWLLLVVLLFQKDGICVNGNCNKEMEALQFVDACPSTASEYHSRRKNCQLQTKIQNCSDPVHYDYHCVRNAFRNTTVTVEFCSPTRKLLEGYCLNFQKEGAPIQNVYASLHGYSDEISKEYKIETVNLTNTKDTPHTEGFKLVLGVIFPVIVVLSVIFSAFVFFLRKRCHNNKIILRKAVELETDIKLLKQTSDTEEIIAFKDISFSTATDRHIFRARRTRKDSSEENIVNCTERTQKMLSEENIADTERYMKTHDTLNRYFVETQMYEKAKDCLIKNGVVILTGPPGCGKSNTAIHLMFQPTYRGWVIRKIRSLNEFAYLDFDERSLVFIDNIFYDSMFNFDQDNCWNEFDKVFETSIKGKKYFPFSIGHDLHLIITARENITEKACLFVKRITHVLNKNCIINELEFELSEKEKDDILSKQEEFAIQERHMCRIEFEGGSKDREIIRKCKGPVGFPLCAHLFACNYDYRKIGKRFFSRPTEFLKIEIEEEIENDQSNKTKTLFFVIFLYQWHLEYVDESLRLQLGNESQCKKFLNAISTNFLQHFGPFDFRKLPIIAKTFTGAFFRENELEGIFKFLHDSVYEAVGVYFCEKHFIKTSQFFPLEVLKMQSYASFEEMSCRILSLRLIYEILSRKLSQIFSFVVFTRKEFVNCFCDEIKSRDDTFIKYFFAVVDNDSFISLPATFWASKNRLLYLWSIMFGLVRKKEINVDFHFYVSLYGICCSIHENLLTRTESMMRNNFEEIKKRVLEFDDEENNSILHIIILSDLSDEDAAFIVQKLGKDGVDVNRRNKCRLTPLMVAVQQTSPRSKVIIELLAQKQIEIKFKDLNGCTVIHHCLMSSNIDSICVYNLKLLFHSKKDDISKIINCYDNKGRTVLNIAATQSQFSRVLSILLLLKCEGIKIEMVDFEGSSPVDNTLKTFRDGCSALALLEGCVRVIIFIENGVSPKKKNDKRGQTVDLITNANLINILANYNDAGTKEKDLDDVLRDVACKHGERETWTVEFPHLPPTTSNRLKTLIQQAVQYLADACLESAMT